MSLLRETPRTITVEPGTLIQVSVVARGRSVAGLRVTIGNSTREALDGLGITVALFRANGSVALTMQGTLDASNTAVAGAGNVSAFVPVGHDVDTSNVTTWWAVMTSPLGAQSVGSTGTLVAA